MVSIQPLLTYAVAQQLAPSAQIKSNKPTLLSTRHTTGYCVRLCDGFYFPAPLVRVSENRAGVQDEICASLCPNSPTMYFSGGAIKESINAQGQKYTQLTTANRFKRAFDKTCSCRSNLALGIGHLRYTHDFTLKRGDIILFDHQPKIFAGSDKFPFDKANFQNPRASQWLATLKTNPAMSEKAKPNEPSSSWKFASVVYSMTDARLAENSNKTTRLISMPRKVKTRLGSLKEILEERASYDY